MKKNTKQSKFNLIFESIKRPLVCIGICAALVISLYAGSISYVYNFTKGDISPRDIYAPYNFSFQGEIDKQKNSQKQKEVMERVLNVYDIDNSVLDNILNNINILFDNASELQPVTDISLQDKIYKIEENLIELSISEYSIKTILEYDNIKKLKDVSVAVINKIMLNGIMLDKERLSIKKSGIEQIILRNIVNNSEKVVNVDAIVTLNEARKQIKELMSSYFPENKKIRSVLGKLLYDMIEPILYFDAEETTMRRMKAASSIDVVYKNINVKQGELIVSKGERISGESIKALATLQKKENQRDRLNYLIGIVFVVIILVLVATVFLKFFEPKMLSNNNNLLLLGTLAVIIVISGKFIISSQFPPHLIPIASAAMLTAILLNSRSAIMMTVLLSVLLSMVVDKGIGVLLMFLIGGTVGVYSVQMVRHRFQLLRAGVFVGISNLISTLGSGFINGDVDRNVLFMNGGWGLLGGVTSAFFVMGMLPVFETIFGITTNVSLLELSDLNQPLLKQLALKAPGTYHHSLIVGNLAESACENIGVNSLLARVGAYYHDIGKMDKAEYFSENQMGGNNKHSQLTPYMSTLVITNHVKDGIELAKKYKLSNTIVDFIKQHHGTGLVYFFYQKALEKTEKSDNSVKEEGFRYPGPKPQSKETAIVLLADSVEAASRVLTDPTPARVRGLVRKIINNKFIDGQLDECELTLKDLEAISDSFVRILTGIFHTRVGYPERVDNNIHKLNNKENAAG